MTINEAIKSKETSSGLRRHIKTSLNAFDFHRKLIVVINQYDNYGT